MNKYHQVTVFGASGRVGRQVVDLLLRDGYVVIAAVHGDKQFPEHDHLTVVSVDVYDAPSIEAAINGSDAVVSTLGSWGTKRKDVLTVGIGHVISAMHFARIDRLVSLTGADARASGDGRDIVHSVTHFALSLMAPRILRDGEQHIALLEKSDLNWTVVRSPIMSGADTIGVGQLTKKRPFPWQRVSRGYVATSIVQTLDDETWSKSAPYIS